VGLDFPGKKKAGEWSEEMIPQENLDGLQRSLNARGYAGGVLKALQGESLGPKMIIDIPPSRV